MQYRPVKDDKQPTSTRHFTSALQGGLILSLSSSLSHIIIFWSDSHPALTHLNPLHSRPYNHSTANTCQPAEHVRCAYRAFHILRLSARVPPVLGSAGAIAPAFLGAGCAAGGRVFISRAFGGADV